MRLAPLTALALAAIVGAVLSRAATVIDGGMVD